jgi:hypothetical protein
MGGRLGSGASWVAARGSALICAAAVAVLGSGSYELRASQGQARDGSVATTGYERFVAPSPSYADWFAALSRLPPAVVSADDVDSMARSFAEAHAKIGLDFGRFAQERDLATVAKQMALDNPNRDAAMKAMAECLDRLRTTAWPRADALLESHWNQVLARAPVEDQPAVLASKRSMVRDLYRRYLVRGVSWSDVGESVDLRQLVRSVAGQTAELADFADPPVDGKDRPWSTLRVRVEGLLDAHDADADAALADAFRRARGVRGKLPDDYGTEKSRQRLHAERMNAFRDVSDKVHAAAASIRDAIGEERGPVAAAEWEDFYLSVCCREAFQAELPSLADRWVKSNVDDEGLRAAVREIHISYLKERTPLRESILRAVRDAKRTSPRPPSQGDDAARSIDAITKARAELSRAAVAAMRSLLSVEDAKALDDYLRSIERAWDPSRPWRNI